MSKREKEKRIEEIKDRLFVMNMKDRWSRDDREFVERLENELFNLQK